MRDNASSHPAAPTTIWTPANIVTLIRILLVPVFFVACVSPWPTWFPDWNEAELLKPWLAALLFVVLACTDALDGYLARSRGEVTNFGKFMDPLADKLLVVSAMLMFVEQHQMPAWALLLVVAREFAVTGLRLIAVDNGRVIAAAWSGKIKTASTMVAICLMLLWNIAWLNTVCWVVIVVTTVYSGVEYFVKNRDVFRKAA